jgi:PDDEXK-like domain of unknown function (DUF3799)
MQVTHKPKLPVKESGVYSGIPLDTYHSDKCTAGLSVSSSNIRTMWSKSPKHMFTQWAHNPQREPRKETEWMRFGRAAHHLLLGEDKFSAEYITHPTSYRDKKTAEQKPWHMGADFCKRWVAAEELKGRTVMKPTEIAKIMPIVESLRADPLVQSDGLRGLVEHSIIVKDEITGLWIKCRPDVIPNDGDYIDIKLTNDVTNLAVMHSLRNFGYHMQGALMWEACEQLKMPFIGFTLLLIESEPPHCIRAVPLTDEDLSLGRLQCRAMLTKTQECIETGIWPGPGEGDLRPIPLPTAERESITKRLEQQT